MIHGVTAGRPRGGHCGGHFSRFIVNIFRIFRGESSLKAQTNDYIKSAFNSLRLIVLIGWAIYPLGYIFGFITPMIGGGEVNINTLLDRIKEEGLNQSDYEWFLDLRRYGSVPHSGFGMGLERVVAWICGISHIRETIPFARTMSRINP